MSFAQLVALGWLERIERRLVEEPVDLNTYTSAWLDIWVAKRQIEKRY